MNNTLIFGVFANRNDAENAIDKLQSVGFNPKDISIVMKKNEQAEDIGQDTGASVSEGIASGVATGAVVGGITGFLAGTALPALGGFLIGGPIGAALGLTGAAATTVSGVATGAVAGGLIGALMQLGLPKEEAEHYESRINEGAILLVVPAKADEEASVAEIFDVYNASDVKALSQTTEEITTSHQHTPHFATVGAKGGKSGRAKGRKGGAATQSGYTGGNLVNPIQVQKYLKNVDYPCTKDQLIETAKREGADTNVLHTLSDMPGEKFDSPKQISEAIGKME